MSRSYISVVINRLTRPTLLSALSILLLQIPVLPVFLHAMESPLLHSTFAGQTDFDEVRALAIGPDGRIFAVSSTRNIVFPISSEDFNILVNAYDPTFQDAVPMMIFGGTRRDEVYAAAFGDDGDLYVCGTTLSPDLPVTPGCHDGTFGGEEDVFVAKISTDPLHVEAVTYLGSTGVDRGHSIAIGSGGDIYVSGSTTSATFPTTEGAYDRTYNGTDHTCGGDLFIARLSPDLSTLKSSTLLGGSGLEACDHSGKIVISENGDVFVAGMTASADFPTTPGAFDQSFNGGMIDIFISRMDPGLTTLVASTLYGGSSDEMVYGFVKGVSNDLFFSAHVMSTDLPVSIGAVDTGPKDDYIARLDDDLTTMLSATYLGAYPPYSMSRVMSMLPGGDIVTAGQHDSPVYPVTPGSFDESFNGEVDAFLTRLDPDL
ncbi:MAG TPA: hypothetical protein VLA34_08225, partial [Candidatus Krumholzibacterium sp.]|nr:hypothetical protein [Candidatus Krumholzibacterium sp.]